MDYIHNFERSLRINRRLVGTGLPVVYEYVISHIFPNGHCMLRHLTINKNNYDTKLTDSIDTIIEQAYTLCEPQFAPVTNVCFSMLSTEFYLDKLTPVTIESITADSVVLSTGEHITVDRLFIKE